MPDARQQMVNCEYCGMQALVDRTNCEHTMDKNLRPTWCLAQEVAYNLTGLQTFIRQRGGCDHCMQAYPQWILKSRNIADGFYKWDICGSCTAQIVPYGAMAPVEHAAAAAPVAPPPAPQAPQAPAVAPVAPQPAPQAPQAPAVTPVAPQPPPASPLNLSTIAQQQTIIGDFITALQSELGDL